MKYIIKFIKKTREDKKSDEQSYKGILHKMRDGICFTNNHAYVLNNYTPVRLNLELLPNIEVKLENKYFVFLPTDYLETIKKNDQLKITDEETLLKNEEGISIYPNMTFNEDKYISAKRYILYIDECIKKVYPDKKDYIQEELINKDLLENTLELFRKFTKKDLVLTQMHKGDVKVISEVDNHDKSFTMKFAGLIQ